MDQINYAFQYLRSRSISCKNPYTLIPLMLSLLLLVISNSAHATSNEDSGIERITLKKTEVIGSQELPRIVSIMSWKKTTPQAIPLLHNALQLNFNPIDQQEFSREILYRRQMQQQ